MPNLAATMAATRKILLVLCAILALTWFNCLVCVYEAKGGGLEEPQGGTTPYALKKFYVLN